MELFFNDFRSTKAIKFYFDSEASMIAVSIYSRNEASEEPINSGMDSDAIYIFDTDEKGIKKYKMELESLIGALQSFINTIK